MGQGTRGKKRSHALENEHKWLYDHPHNYQCKCQPDKEKGENDLMQMPLIKHVSV